MRCPYCFGTGKRMRASEIGPDYVIGSRGPCGECQGSGVIHCCEGDRACPEDDQPSADIPGAREAGDAG